MGIRDDYRMEQVVVQSMPDYSYTLVINDGKHALVADEPPAEGGDGLGPNPYELLLAALGACTAMTLTMYARRKEWPLEEISVHLTHDRVFASDCADCSDDDRTRAGPGGKIEILKRDISVRGDLTDEQVQRLLEIAERCPVHRTLQTPPKVLTSIICGT
jgi:putative redox protein